ncbi:hypothetical protein [Gordonia sputi]
MMTFFMIVAILVVGFFALAALLAVFGEDDPSPLSSADRERATPSERQFAAALSGIDWGDPRFGNELALRERPDSDRVIIPRVGAVTLQPTGVRAEIHCAPPLSAEAITADRVVRVLGAQLPGAHELVLVSSTRRVATIELRSRDPLTSREVEW